MTYEWFSGLGNNLVEIAKRQIETDREACNRYWHAAIDLAFGASPATNPALASTSRKVLIETGLGTRSKADEDWPLWTYLLIVGWLLEAERDGEAERALMYSFAAGSMWGELEARWKWGKAARSGKASIDGGASTRIATDAERFGIVLRIIEAEKVSQSRAFIIAEERHPELGSEASFRGSFFKHRKKLTPKAV